MDADNVVFAIAFFEKCPTTAPRFGFDFVLDDPVFQLELLVRIFIHCHRKFVQVVKVGRKLLTVARVACQDELLFVGNNILWGAIDAQEPILLRQIFS